MTSTTGLDISRMTFYLREAHVYWLQAFQLKFRFKHKRRRGQSQVVQAVFSLAMNHEDELAEILLQLPDKRGDLVR